MMLRESLYTSSASLFKFPEGDDCRRCLSSRVETSYLLGRGWTLQFFKEENYCRINIVILLQFLKANRSKSLRRAFWCMSFPLETFTFPSHSYHAQLTDEFSFSGLLRLHCSKHTQKSASFACLQIGTLYKSEGSLCSPIKFQIPKIIISTFSFRVVLLRKSFFPSGSSPVPSNFLSFLFQLLIDIPLEQKCT